MRAVVDANVLLSALLGGRGTRPVLDALLDRRFHVVTSELLLFVFLADLTGWMDWGILDYWRF